MNEYEEYEQYEAFEASSSSSSSSDTESDDENAIERVRRPYTIRNRQEHLEIWDDVDFARRFRLRKDTVLILLGRIEDQLEVFWNVSRALSPLNQLLLALRFYATGSFLISAGDFSGVCVSTASRIILKVSRVIAMLRPDYIRLPQNRQEIQSLKTGFYAMHRFPHVIGCIDGTHIRINSPGGPNAELFRNRKGYFSLNVQVLSDHNFRMLLLDGEDLLMIFYRV